MLNSLDWNAVAAAIRYTDERTPALLEFDYEAVAEAVLKAADHWALRDYETYEILGVERKFERPIEVDGRPLVISGVLDLEMRAWRDGAYRIVDWKTRGAQDFGAGDVWADRYRDSWQGRLYSLETGAKDMEWRGICRGGAVKTVMQTYQEGQGINTFLQLEGVLRQMLAVEKMIVWPRHMPSSCGAYGTTCAYKKLCRENTAPKQPLPVTRMSYSDMDTFLTCPEKYRLGEVLSLPETDRSNLDFGSAFHRGIAEVYMQLQRLQQEQKAA